MTSIRRNKVIMNHKIIVFTLSVSVAIFSFSCKKKQEFESNAILLKKAIAAGQDGYWDKAKQLAFKAKEQDPKDANARTMFALALEQCEDKGRAIEEIKIATSLDPSNFMAQYTKARLLFNNEIYEDCPAPLEKAKELRPNTPQVLLLLAQTYSMLSNYDESINNYIKLAKLPQYKNSPEIYNELGVLFFKKKDYKKAVRLFNKAYSEQPDSKVVNLNLAVFWDTITMLCNGNKSKAAKAAGNAVKYYEAYVNMIGSAPYLAIRKQNIEKRISELKKISQ